MAEQFANSDVTTLAGTINNSQTTLTVANATTFPLIPSFRILIDSELMMVTALAGPLFTVTRGIEGTTAAPHNSGAAVSGVVTAGSLSGLISVSGTLVNPIGGGVDDWAPLQLVLNANAYLKPTILQAGTYQAKTTINVPNGTVLLGNPGVKIVGGLPTSPDVPNIALFYATMGAQGQITTLASAAAKGSFSITTSVDESANWSVGTILQIANPLTAGNSAGFRVSTHTIVLIAGTIINLDRPLPRNYPSGSTVANFATIPQDIIIDGGGMTITGNCIRYGEFAGARRVMVKNITFADSASGMCIDYCWSFDGASYDCHYENINIIVTGAHTPFGLAMESTDGCSGTRCSIDGPTSIGFGMYDCTDCLWQFCRTMKFGAVGFFWGADTAVHSATTEGSIDCMAIGCEAIGGTGPGFENTDGSLNTRLMSCSAQGNSTFGLSIGDAVNTTTVPDGTMVESSSFRYNATAGIKIYGNALRTQLVGVDVSSNGTLATNGTGILAASDCDIEGMRSIAGNGTNVINSTGGFLRATHLKVINSQIINVIYLNGTSRSDIRSSDLACTAGANGINNTVSTNLYMDNVIITGASFGLAQNNAPSEIGRGCDFSGCTAEIMLGGAGPLVVQQGGVSMLSVTTADVTLTFAQMKAASLVNTGSLTAARNVIIPIALAVNGMEWDASNFSGGAFSLTFKTSTGTGIAIAQGKSQRIRCDGVNMVAAGPST